MVSANCVHFTGETNGSQPLYKYFRGFPNGSNLVVEPVRHEETGLCYYPGARCQLGPCCTWTSWVDDGLRRSSNIVTFAELGVFVPCLCGVLWWVEQLRRRAETDLALRRHVQQDLLDRRPPSGTPERLNTFGVIFGTIVAVLVGVLMARNTQMALPVQSRNAMLATAAFLEPIKDVFQFLEDTTTVKITYAIGTGNYGPIRTIARVGVLGGLATGASAALLMTGLAFWSDAMQVFVAPGSSADLQRFPGCPLITDPAAVVATAQTLWFFKVWSWPFQFCSMALTGLLLGARELLLFGFTQVASSLTYFGIWQLGEPTTLHLLGWASLGSQVVLFTSCASCIWLDIPLRRKFGLMASNSACDSHMDMSVQRQALKDGLLAMSLDLSLQATSTIGVYVAGYQGLSILFQISAVGAALPQYVCVAEAVAMIVKLAGSVMIGNRMYTEFRTLLVGMVACAAVLGVISAVAVLNFRMELAGGFGSQSCVFATDSACLGIYAGLFWGDDGKPMISRTFTVLAFNATMSCLFAVVRAGLYACQDFAFMARAAAAVLPAVFLPAIAFACYAFDSAAAVYVACALPTWVLTAVFFVRLHRNSRCMLLREDGPWLHSMERRQVAASELESAALWE